MKTTTKSFFDKKNSIVWNNHFALYSYKWMITSDSLLPCINDFIESYNQLQLVFNYYTNLHVKEDLSQMGGMTTYGIDIPLEYFRFPYLNDPRQCSNTNLKEDEAQIIRDIVSTSKKKLNYVKDESVIDEIESRFEFLTLYSLFEGFCESLLVEKNRKSSIDINKVVKAQGDFIRNNNLLTIIKKVFSYYDPEIYAKIQGLQNDFEPLLRLFYSLRNLYTHRNGFVTKRFINQGLEDPAFLNFDSYDKENNRDVYSVFCMFGNYYVYENKNFNCQVVNSHLRAIAVLVIEVLKLEET